jgi:hypothetical protein
MIRSVLITNTFTPLEIVYRIVAEYLELTLETFLPPILGTIEGDSAMGQFGSIISPNMNARTKVRITVSYLSLLGYTNYAWGGATALVPATTGPLNIPVPK